MNYLIYSWISIWKLWIGLKKMLILTIFNLLAILKIIVIFSLWNVQVPLCLGISKLALNIVVFWLHDINFSALIGGILRIKVAWPFFRSNDIVKTVKVALFIRLHVAWKETMSPLKNVNKFLL